MSSNTEIRILLVDDIAETRESIKKLLAFEADFKVIGDAANGREGVEQTKELQPDIVIMDINMPDMDGLEAAALITKAVPTAGVIMMSVQDDSNYMQKAMLAGARFFLSKPVDMDQLYNTIRTVYDQMAHVRWQVEQMQNAATTFDPSQMPDPNQQTGDRAGHVISVYSPQGGAGTTTIATSLASGLMKEGIKVLLVDADLEFGDVGAFLNIQPQSTIAELVENIEDLDTEYFDNSVMTHDSGIKVLLGPPRPMQAAEIRESNPEAVADVIRQIRNYYDFIVVDTTRSLDAMTVSVLDISTKIVLVVTPNLPSIKNVRLAIDLFDQLSYEPERICLTINRAAEDRNRKKSTIEPERIQKFLKRAVEGIIPQVEERVILGAINKGVPVIASDRDQSKSPIKQLLQLSEHLYGTLMGVEESEEEAPAEENPKRRSGIFSFGS